jgi:methyltransferase (TIGR00027 family)
MAQLSGIGATAISVAYLRALESERDDRLFDDPYARRLGTAADGQEFLPTVAELMGGQVAVRTRFFDDALLAATAQGTRQVALLGCGMDTRALRLRWPDGVRVFEVDLPETLAYKSAVLGDTGRIPVAADLREDWPSALAAAGWRPDRPTAWLVEGLLYALPAEAADALLDRITAESAPGSTIGFDQVEGSDDLIATLGPELARLWRGGPTGEPGAWLARHGWQPDVHDVAAVAARYGRPTPPLFRTTHGWLGTATLSRS